MQYANSLTAPPSFSVASEKVLGSWVGAITTSMSSPCYRQTTVEVEEVMRSCGGAVQGFEETRHSADNEDPISTYMNRADEKFTFFDCGSYCVGPVQRDMSGKTIEKYLFVLNENQDTRSVFVFERNNNKQIDNVLYSYEVRASCKDKSRIEQLLTGSDAGSMSHSNNNNENSSRSDDVHTISDKVEESFIQSSFTMPIGSKEVWNPMKLKFSSVSNSALDVDVDMLSRSKLSHVHEVYTSPDGGRSIVIDTNSHSIECLVPSASMCRKYNDEGSLTQVTFMRRDPCGS